jgi:hypothetical protein
VTAPELAREMPDGSRRYIHPVTGQSVPSVTTVLSVIAKPKLTGWAARSAAQYAVANWEMLSQLDAAERCELIMTAHERSSGAAASKGDTVHELIQAWSTGVPFPEVPKEVGGFVSQYISFLMTEQPVFLANEVTMWSHEHGYAGTCDWIARIGTGIILADVKSGRRAYPEAGLQVAALAGADVIIAADGTERELPVISSLAVLHIRPRSWKLIPVKHRQENLAAFLAALQLWRWQHETAPDVLEAA